MRANGWVAIALGACTLAFVGCATGEGPGSGNPDASTIGFPDAAGGGGNPDAAGGGMMTVTLRQSTTDTITAVNSISCNNGSTFHQDNRYFRVYDLPSLGINAAFNVTTVHVGIESAASGGGTQNADVRIHSLTGTPVLAGLSQIATTPLSIADQGAGILDVPVAATVPAGQKMVVEFHTPEGETNTNLLFIGSNASGESAPSYIVAPSAGCDVTEMTTPNALGTTDMHIVLKVTGNYIQ